MTEKALIGTLYRAYGDHPLEVEWPHKPGITDVVVTQDHSREHVLRGQGFTPVVYTASTQEMGRNPAEVINLGLLEHKKLGTEYVLLVSSGLQKYILDIENFLNFKFLEKKVNFDVIFFVLEGLFNLSKSEFKAIALDREKVLEYQEKFFPSESLAVINLASIDTLEDKYSSSGFMGYTKQNLPLGGSELLLSLMATYKQSEYTWVPKMYGVWLPTSQFERDQQQAYPFLSIQDKTERRLATIRAMMQHLKMNDDEYVAMFKDTALLVY